MASQKIETIQMFLKLPFILSSEVDILYLRESRMKYIYFSLLE